MNYFIYAETKDGHAYLGSPYGDIWHVWMGADRTPRIERLTEAEILALHINMTKHIRAHVHDQE